MKIVALFYFKRKDRKGIRKERRNILSVTIIKMPSPN
jgi:hypothetical protein